MTDPITYVCPVPDHCDRITWRGLYYHLPLKTSTATPPAATCNVNTGMTLRDYFAGQALAGMVTRRFEEANPDYVTICGSVVDAFARQAYTLADAMLAARTTPASSQG